MRREEKRKQGKRKREVMEGMKEIKETDIEEKRRKGRRDCRAICSKEAKHKCHHSKVARKKNKHTCTKISSES